MTGRRKGQARRRSRRAGFALLAVIWGTGVISLLVVSFLSTGRLRLQTAHNISSAAQAAYIAEGVVNLATLSLLEARGARAAAPASVPRYDGAPRFCVFEGAAVAVAVEQESGKVDLNAAPPALLRTMLVGFGLDGDSAERVARAIVAYRTAPVDAGQPALAASSDKPFPPKQAPFQTILELDQVTGVSPALFRELIPFVTVHSRNPGVDARKSPPALFAALAGFPLKEVEALKAAPFPNRLNRDDPRLLAGLQQFGAGSILPQGDGGAAFLVHVETVLATGQTAAREVVVDLQAAGGRPFALRETRRGRSLYAAHLRDMVAANGAGVPDC